MNNQYQIALSFATEDQKLVDAVYHYLRAEGINVFFAPSREAQVILGGRNQREIFYDIFGLNAEYVALFVSKNYIAKEVPMEEARIAFAKHGDNGSAIPIYIDGTPLPEHMFDPKSTNYFRSNNPAEIATHLAARVRMSHKTNKETDKSEGKQKNTNLDGTSSGDLMIVRDNTAKCQIFIQNYNDINGASNYESGR